MHLRSRFNPAQTLIFWLYFFHWHSLLAQQQEEISGELEVHKQQWPGRNALSIGESEPSADLQECLRRCCARSDCKAVGFSGFLGDSQPGTANCSLFACPSTDCSFEDTPPDAGLGGILSVRLRRPNEGHEEMTLPPAESSTSSLPITTSTPIGPSVSLFEYKTTASTANIGEEEGPNRTWPFDRTNEANQRQNPSASEGRRSLLDLNSWDERFPLNAEHTPVWAIGLAIVVTVVSLGLLLTFLATFLCYRRYRSRMRSAEINGPKKMPTLHAFNPS